MTTTDEFVVINMSFPVLNDGPNVALELLHLSMEHPHWDDASISLAKQAIISNFRSQKRSMQSLLHWPKVTPAVRMLIKSFQLLIDKLRLSHE